MVIVAVGTIKHLHYCLSSSVLRAHFCSVFIKNTFMRITKNDFNSVFDNMLQSIKTLFILINYQKIYIILIIKRK